MNMLEVESECPVNIQDSFYLSTKAEKKKKTHEYISHRIKSRRQRLVDQKQGLMKDVGIGEVADDAAGFSVS